MTWIGPFKIGDMLDNSHNDSLPKPPESNGVYVVSRKPWACGEEPTKECKPLYVGSNTGKSARFRTRIGDLIADGFGYYGEKTGHHSGGQSIHVYCKEHNVNLKELYIGWVEECVCARCEENNLYKKLEPPLNKKKPSKCNDHPTDAPPSAKMGKRKR
jgi:hypothetical protein